MQPSRSCNATDTVSTDQFNCRSLSPKRNSPRIQCRRARCLSTDRYCGAQYFNAKGVSIPVAVSVFPDELYPAPRSWAERAYPKLIHYNKLDKGGHFAAWEQPEIFSEELRAGFRPLLQTILKPAALARCVSAAKKVTQ